MKDVVDKLQEAVYLLMEQKTGVLRIDEEIDRISSQISLAKIELYKFDKYLKNLKRDK